MDSFENRSHSTIAKLFRDSMEIVWLVCIQYYKVLLFVTDAASYTVKAGAGLQVLFEKTIRLICLAHGLNEVTEDMREMHPNVNSMISSGKKVFCKTPHFLQAPHFLQTFKEMAQIPLPLEPVY